MTKRILLFVALALMIPAIVLAGTNGILSGTVKDKDGKPLGGATVKVQGTTRGAISKSDGKYNIVNIPAGSYEVKVTYVGLESSTIKVIINADKTTNQNFTLKPADNKQKTVVVVGDRLVNKEDIGKVKSVSGEQITATTRESAVSIASTQAGVQASGGGLVVRGSRNTDNKYLVDGQDVTDVVTGTLGSAASAAGAAYAPTASAFATEDVQVVTGNASAQYGNALGGVVNTVMKTGKTNEYEGFLRWKTDVPSLFGKSSNGVQALASIENTYEFGFGGPLPFLSKSTFYISSKYFTDKYRDNSLDVNDKAGNSLGQFDNNNSSVRNITGRMVFGLTDDMKLTVGGTWGLTSLAFNGWSWLYATSPSMTYKYTPTGIDTTIYSTIPESYVKLGGLNNYIYSYFLRLDQTFDNNNSIQATVSYNNNISEEGRIDNGLIGSGSILKNGVIQTPGNVTTSMPNASYFSGYKIYTPEDNYVTGGGGALLERKTSTQGDKVIDIYTPIRGTVYKDADPTTKLDVNMVNNLTGYVEGEADASGTKNPYGLSGIFNSRGNSGGFEFRRSDFVQFESNYTQIFDVDSVTRHLLKAGVDARYYTVRRYSNQNPWSANPFFDVYSDQFGGDIYSLTDAERTDGSKPRNALMGSAYVEDQISIQGIILNPSLRLDVFDPNTLFRQDPTKPTGDKVAANIKTQLNPRMHISYPVGDRSFFSISYGIFTQMPRFSYLYDGTNTAITRGNMIVGNPNMVPERTNQFDVAYNTMLGDDFAFDVSAYYKDMYGISGLVYVPDNRYPYTLYSNGEYGNARGVEFTFRRQLVNHFSFNVNYTLAYAQGTASNAGSNYNSIISGTDPFSDKKIFPLTEFPFSYDRRHRVNFIFDLDWKADEGPAIGGIKFLQNTHVNFTGFYQTGLPYTRLDIKGTQISETNAARFPSSWQIDMRLQRTIALKDIYEGFGNTQLVLFADVINLTNRTEAVSVYARTGDPNNDGVSLYRQVGEFVSTSWYSKADSKNPASIAAEQFDRAGNRYYNANADRNRDGVVTQTEQYQSYLDYVNDAFARRGNFQFPRQVFFGAQLRF